MIKHVVFMKFRSGIDGEKLAELEKRLATLPAAIPEIRGYEFGRDILKTERSYDFALVSAFEDVDAMKRYQVHPNHVEVAQLLGEICEDIRAVDFTLTSGGCV